MRREKRLHSAAGTSCCSVCARLCRAACATLLGSEGGREADGSPFAKMMSRISCCIFAFSLGDKPSAPYKNRCARQAASIADVLLCKSPVQLTVKDATSNRAKHEAAAHLVCQHKLEVLLRGGVAGHAGIAHARRTARRLYARIDSAGT